MEVMEVSVRAKRHHLSDEYHGIGVGAGYM